MRLKQIALPVLHAGLGLVLWQAVTRVVGNSRVAPDLGHIVLESYPSFAIFGAAADNDYGEATRILAWNSLQTAERALLGLVLGGISGVAAGVILFSLRRGRPAARLLLMGIMNVPLFSIVPLFVYWFSGQELGIVLYVVLAVSMLVAAGTYEAAANIPLSYFWQASLAGAGQIKTLRSVVLPAILPELLLTLRWVLGLTWAFTLGAEYLSSSSGCGFLAYQSYLYADVGKLIVLSGVYAILGYTSLSLFDIVTTKMLPRQLLTIRG